MRDEYLGERGYSLLGAVVAATKPHDAAVLRQIMPQQIFLVPGFGAQGGAAAYSYTRCYTVCITVCC